MPQVTWAWQCPLYLLQLPWDRGTSHTRCPTFITEQDTRRFHNVLGLRRGWFCTKHLWPWRINRADLRSFLFWQWLKTEGTSKGARHIVPHNFSTVPSQRSALLGPLPVTNWSVPEAYLCYKFLMLLDVVMNVLIHKKNNTPSICIFF